MAQNEKSTNHLPDYRPPRRTSQPKQFQDQQPAKQYPLTKRCSRPNIVLVLTDQERSHRHWPLGWAESNLTTHYNCLIGCCRNCDGTSGSTYHSKNTQTFHPRSPNASMNSKRSFGSRSSVVFTKAFTATTECSPSRASLLTSSYPSEHGVVTTPGILDPRTDHGLVHVVAETDRNSKQTKKNSNPGSHSDETKSNDRTFPETEINSITERPNLLRLLSTPTRKDGTQGYDVAWKGKWHLNPPVSSSSSIYSDHFK